MYLRHNTRYFFSKKLKIAGKYTQEGLKAEGEQEKDRQRRGTPAQRPRTTGENQSTGVTFYRHL